MNFHISSFLHHIFAISGLCADVEVLIETDWYLLFLPPVVQLKEVLVNMLLDGQPLELVDDILQVIPVADWSARNAFTDAMSTICQHLR